jgi:uroporphyrinogen decarboxylase
MKDMTDMNDMNDRFLRACRREPVDCTPVWFMRQAGRYMPEYRAVRARHSLLEICRQPELAAEVTLQPVRALGVDAAILFADILLPLIPMGAQLEFAAGEGPVIANPVRTEGDVGALRPVDVHESLGHVLQAVRLLRRELEGKQPLIGFAGAPFTLASYLVEGGGSRTYLRTKQLMYADPRAWHALMGKLARVVADYLVAQVNAGAQAVQLFDSWAGALSPDDYREYVLPHSRLVLSEVAATGVPVIHFGTDTATLLPSMVEAGGTVIGLDWRIPLDEGWQLVGDGKAVQGNLDPTALFAPRDGLERRVRRILEQAAGRPGHIFNTGHGLLPETPVDNVRAVVDMVHELSREYRSDKWQPTPLAYS